MRTNKEEIDSWKQAKLNTIKQIKTEIAEEDQKFNERCNNFSCLANSSLDLYI